MTTRRRTMTLSLVAVLVATLGLGSVPASADEHLHNRGIDEACPPGARAHQPFADTSTSPHRESIGCVAYWGIVSGRTAATYGPGGAVSRAAMASFLVGTMEIADYTFPGAGPRPRFDDTSRSVHALNIDRASESGVVVGIAPRAYRPNAPVSRAAMATFIVRMIETVTGEAIEAGDDHDPAFPDTAGNPHEGSINKLASIGVVQGRQVAGGANEYGPSETVNRAAMASFVARAADYLAANGFWPVPETLRMHPEEVLAPTNADHRVTATVRDQLGGPYPGAEIRIEVYRRVGIGDLGIFFLQVADGRTIGGRNGSATFAYRAGASSGDRDIIIACVLEPGDEPESGDSFCSSVTFLDLDELIVFGVEPRGDRVATAAAVTWGSP